MEQIQPIKNKLQVAAPKALYIHIPFCTNKCFYCDFNSYVLKGQPVMEYLEAMEREMAQTTALQPPGVIETIFVGGGTPTVLTPEQMDYFLKSIHRAFPHMHPNLEFSMEANPGTTDLEKLKVMRAGGVNRISFGVQSFNNQLLGEIGRIHNTDDVYRSIENARAAGFDNMSIDLMFGLPNQTLEMLDDSITKALELNLPHYSIYSLKVEENTLFHAMFQKNQLPLPDEDVELEMYLLLMNRMKEAGYEQYEISNFAKPGMASRHNMKYWLNESYYGIGAGAHGYVNRERHVNIKGVQAYNDASKLGFPRLEQYEISIDEAMEDFMMVGLRMLQGVSREHFREQFNAELDHIYAPQLKKLLDRGLIEESDKGYKLSEQGILFGNDVFAEFIDSHD